MYACNVFIEGWGGKKCKGKRYIGIIRGFTGMDLVFYPMVLGMESIQSDDFVPHQPAPHYDCLFYSYVCLIINPRSILARKTPKIDEIECGSSLLVYPWGCCK